MNYLKDIFLKDEKIRYKAKYHYMIYILPFILFIVAIGIIVFGKEKIILSLYFIGLSYLFALYIFLKNKYSDFVITNKRLIMKTGLLYKKSVDILLKDVGFYRVKQSIIGELFGYGSFVISMTSNKEIVFRKISNPDAFKDRLDKELFNRDLL